MSALVCAHRGASATHPENTLAAFEAAIAAGAGAVELDVHVTADMRLAVLHDATLERTAGVAGAVAGLDAARLRTVAASGGRGLQVPLLEEVLELCRGRVRVLVEVKADAVAHPEASALVAGAAASTGTETDVWLLAFDERHLEAACSLAPGLPRVLLGAADPGRLIERAGRLDAAAVGPLWTTLDGRVCERAHAAGLAVVAWTVDDGAAAVRLDAEGADVLVTNDPARIVSALAARG